MEVFTNNASSPLSAILSGASTTLTVASASGFPNTGNFRINVDNEIMLVTGVSGTTFTVSRGQENTSAVAHNAGANVVHILTAGALAQFRAETNQQGTPDNLPAAGYAGRMYQVTYGTFLHHDTGSAWNAYAPIQLLASLPSSGWAFTNQGSATATFQGGTLFLANSGATTGFNIYYRTVTAPYTITVLFDSWGMATSSFHSYSIGFHDSVGGKWSEIQCGLYNSGGEMWVEAWNNAGSQNSTYAHVMFGTTYPSGHFPLPNWLRLTDDGTTNRTYQYSFDGMAWVTMFSVSRTNFLTPNAVGVAIRKDGTDSSLKALRVLSWYQTSP